MLQITPQQMDLRLVRYGDLIPCTTAFVDTRSPGSDRKENFTIIGPGVAENPDQHVHITIPHGFNIGGARQPPHCINSQHSHQTAEVFIVHTGQWRFTTGHDALGPSIDLGPGDTISLPSRIFRGFENVGQETGFMFAILGGDDPGRVTWAPGVFQAAARYGLVLLENGRLIDTAKEEIPAGAVRMKPPTEAELAQFDRASAERLSACVQRFSDLSPQGGLTRMDGFEECPIIGAASPREEMPAGKMAWTHRFQLRALRAAPKARSLPHVRSEEEVILMHRGVLRLEWASGEVELASGDTLTVPKSLERTLVNPSNKSTVAFIVRGGEHPKPALVNDR
jgi:mannose-6-phosphate isomerase-like protein (cupin superfamily)